MSIVLRYRTLVRVRKVGAALIAVMALPHIVANAQTAPQPETAAVPADAKYACPMETHPDESDAARQGAYFSAEEGKCLWCGMKLKPIGELPWVAARQAAAGAEVAYTCPDHQQVFSRASGECPRCGRKLEPFKAMYTCPDPSHAGRISLHEGRCPDCRRRMTPFRGVWLSQAMAERNALPNAALVEGAAYRCRMHPLVHSDRPGQCPICAAELSSAAGEASEGREARAKPAIPPGAAFVCPMEECEHFAAQAGECPKCGMRLKPIAEVAWARARRTDAEGAAAAFICPMHPRERFSARGTCSICGMQLVSAASLSKPAGAPDAIAAQVDYLMEHYLALQKRFASDSTREVALHSLGLVGAADEILRRTGETDAGLKPGFAEAVRSLRGAALKTNGQDLDADRVTFVALSRAMATIVEHVRPGTERYPKLYLFHCPMTKGDWIQSSDDMENPFYGFAMLKCGEQTGVR